MRFGSHFVSLVNILESVKMFTIKSQDRAEAYFDQYCGKILTGEKYNYYLHCLLKIWRLTQW